VANPDANLMQIVLASNRRTGWLVFCFVNLPSPLIYRAK